MGDYTYAAIRDRILSALQSAANRLEGGFGGDNAQAVAQELARYHSMAVEPIQDRVHVDTAEADDLDRKGAEYNVVRNPAMPATGLVQFRGRAGVRVPKGALVHSTQCSYKTTAAGIMTGVGVCTLPVACTQPGPQGNAEAGAINSIQPAVNGVTGVTNVEPLTGGVDIEADDAYRQRILERIRLPLTSGNANHYVMWAREVAGVGYARCIPCWAGAGTVKVVIISDTGGTPAQQVLDAARAHIEGNRPIGADVTVEAAQPLAVRVEMTLALATGYLLDDVRQAATDAIAGYCKDAALRGDKHLSYYRISDIVLGIPGIADITAYTLNGGMDALKASDTQYYTLSEVVLHGG